jgi:hypothetical protein
MRFAYARNRAPFPESRGATVAGIVRLSPRHREATDAMTDIATQMTKRFLSRPQQAKRYGKSTKTVIRWGKNERMNMPPEYDLCGSPHRAEDELEAWERTRVAAPK